MIRILGVVALMGLSPLAAFTQARGPVRAGARAGPAATIVTDLFNQAKAALAAEPAIAAPRLLATIAEEEIRLDPAQAAADDTRAFGLALALAPAGADADDLGADREEAKEATEVIAVRDVTRAAGEERGLALARLADVPKGPLYDELIVAAALSRRGRNPPDDASSGPPSSADEPSLSDRVFDLVEECKRADGTYPYRGVASLIARRQIDAYSRMLLVRDAYQWAASQSDPAQLSEATALLQAGHIAEPELDGELASTLVSMLGQVARSALAGPFAGASATSAKLFSLLQKVDPMRAQSLALPNLDAFSSSFGQTGSAPGRLVFNFSTNVFSASGYPFGGGSDSAVTTQFAPLVSMGEAQVRRNPSAALALANQASGLLDAEVLSSALGTAARLADLYYRLGDAPDGANVLGRVLDAADQQARDADASYFAADGDQQALLAEDVASAQSGVLDAYSMAARIDLASTARRAEGAQFALLKPILLARLAVIAEVAQPPAY